VAAGQVMEPPHPLKTRSAPLLQALHFMRDWQVNPFCRGFATSRSSFSSLGFGLLSDPWRSDTPRERLTGLSSKPP
jgi:hypothetical protein